MSEHIPQWLLAFFVAGSPVQEFLNRWIPERFRPVILWVVAAGIVAVAVVSTPLGWADLLPQITLVYAALASGWAMSQVIAPPLPAGVAAARAVLIVGVLAGLAIFLPGIVAAQWDSVTAETPVALADPATGAGTAENIVRFVWAQLSAFIGASFVRWLGRKRPGSLRNK